MKKMLKTTINGYLIVPINDPWIKMDEENEITKVVKESRSTKKKG